MPQSRHISTFANGQVQDIDKHLQPRGSYRYALNGRVRYNTQRDTKDGKMFAFSNERGTFDAFTLPGSNELVGAIDFGNDCLVFSGDGVNSEIGLLTISESLSDINPVQYQTLYNDKYDPNGDKLNLLGATHFDGFPVVEGATIRRATFITGNDQSRTVDLSVMFQSPGISWHRSIANNTRTLYPKSLSVHAMNGQMDVFFPTIIFQERIAGLLLSGQYVYLGRYKSKTGHSSVWSPVRLPVFVTDREIKGVNNSNNHHNRVMGASLAQTTEGVRLQIKDLDMRWDQFEVAYLYLSTQAGPSDAVIFKTIDIVTNSITVDHTGLSGIPFAVEEASTRYEYLDEVKAIVEKNNLTYFGGMKVLTNPNIDVSGITIAPVFQELTPDKTTLPTYDNIANPVSGRGDNDPLTNSDLVTLNLTKQKFAGKTETYPIKNDYFNDKGQQVVSEFTGYQRGGEVYPFGLLMRDIKGNPMFVIPIRDYSTPALLDAPLTVAVAQGPTNTYRTRSMGLRFSGIRLPRNVLFDEKGKQRYGSFEIVRTERMGVIRWQGVAFNTVRTISMGSDSAEQLKMVSPLPAASNEFALNTDRLGPPYVYGSKVNFQKFIFGNTSVFNIHSPDVLIEGKLDKPTETDYLEVAGVAHTVYNNITMLRGGNRQFYTKNYKINANTTPSAAEHSRPKVGKRSRIKYWFLNDNGDENYVYEKFDSNNLEMKFKSHAEVTYQRRLPNALTSYTEGVDDVAFRGLLQPNAIVAGLKDIEYMDAVSVPDNSWASYYILNFKRSLDATKLNQDTRQYFSTGHYQALDAATLNAVDQVKNPDGSVREYVFNGVDVWGGDTHVNLFDFARLYPARFDCAKESGNYRDTSTGLIIPIESKYNLALRFGRTYAANATKPEMTSCEGLYTQFSNGILWRQPEDWNINDVLTYANDAVRFPSLPSDFTFVTDRPTTIFYSNVKNYGEKEDSYRKILPLNYYDLSGVYGRINKLVSAFSYIYCFQENAYGIVRASERAVIATSVGDVVTGTGKALDGITYLSSEYGSQHPYGVVKYRDTIYWWDARRGAFCRHSQAGLDDLSDSEAMHDFSATVSPALADRKVLPGMITDVVAGVDSENRGILMTLSGRDLHDTLLFDEAGQFGGHFTFTPRRYFRHRRFMLSSPGQGRVYIHNEGKYGHYYGNYYPTVLRFVVNPSPTYDKTFSNMGINVDPEGLKRIGTIDLFTQDDAQRVAYQDDTVLVDFRMRYRNHILRFPIRERQGGNGPLRGKYLEVEVTIDNKNQLIDGQDLPVTITHIETDYRPNHRI